MAGEESSSQEDEWIMMESDVSKCRRAVVKQPQPLVFVKKYLAANKLKIGPKTFSTGMTLVLYQSCVAQMYDIADYLLGKYVKDYSVNQIITINPDPYRPFPSNAMSDKVAIHKTTLVHGAVKGTSIPILKLLMRLGASLNTPDCCYKVPIMIAIENHDLNMIKFLISQKANLNCRDRHGLTPLMCITTQPSFMAHLIPRMVEEGADMSLRDERGYTALHIAVYEGTSEAVQQLLQIDVLKEVKYSSIPHPSVLFDCGGQKYFASDGRKSAICRAFEKYSSSMSKKQQVDALLTQATFHLHDALLQKQNCITYFEHKFAEALVLKTRLEVPLDTNTAEIQTYEELKSKFIHVNPNVEYVSKVKDAVFQSLLIQERCIGKGSRTMYEFVKTASMWMIQKEQYDYGMELLHLMSDTLVHVTRSIGHPSAGCLQPLTFQLLDKLKQLFHGSISKVAQSEGVAEITLIGKHLLRKYFDSIIRNIIQSICFCSLRAKEIHGHTIPQKSASLLINEFFSDVFDFVALKNPVLFGVNVSKLVAELVEKCPSTLLDINGNPTTLLHLVLSVTDDTKQLVKLVLENGGDHMINAVGPCGNRPIQTVYNESVIQLLIEHGAHLDAVNSSGKSAFDSIRPFVADSLVPDIKKLSCLCSVLVANTIPYQSLDLPLRVKSQILLHDKKAESIIAKEELLTLV